MPAGGPGGENVSAAAVTANGRHVFAAHLLQAVPGREAAHESPAELARDSRVNDCVDLCATAGRTLLRTPRKTVQQASVGATPYVFRESDDRLLLVGHGDLWLLDVLGLLADLLLQSAEEVLAVTARGAERQAGRRQHCNRNAFTLIFLRGETHTQQSVHTYGVGHASFEPQRVRERPPRHLPARHEGRSCE